MKNKLFLICPECHTQHYIRTHYGENCFFLTALGTVFNIDEFEYAEEVNMFMSSEDVKFLYIVNDFSCTFIQNILTEGNKHDTKAEHTLLKLYNNNIERFEHIEDLRDKSIKMAKLNIYRQAYALLDVAFLGNKIKDGDLILRGLIYDRNEGSFIKIDINL